MKIIVERVKTHRDLILNYFSALAPTAGGRMAAPTTGPTERRNGTIKNAWKAGRGLHNMEMFSMRALYEPWQLDIDIGVCSEAGCVWADGPFPNRNARLSHVVRPGYRHYCPSHTPP